MVCDKGPRAAVISSQHGSIFLPVYGVSCFFHLCKLYEQKKLADREMVCDKGQWTGFFLDRRCQCKPPPLNSCPEEAPDFNTPCNVNSSLKCPYGENECCGKISPDREMVCTGGSWTGLFIDNSCLFGRACG